MIIGIGIDYLEHDQLASVAGLWDDPFFKRTFTDAEYAECLASPDPIARFAGRFCVKEALVKALDGFADVYDFHDIETLSGPNGNPQVRLVGDLSDVLPENVSLHVSISHDRHASVAFVIAERHE